MSPQHSGHKNNSHHIISYSSHHHQAMVCNIYLRLVEQQYFIVTEMYEKQDKEKISNSMIRKYR